MKYISIKSIIMVLSLKIISINCSKPPPWFIHDAYLYYVDVEPKHTSNTTEIECLKLKMTDTITQSRAGDLLTQLQQIYGPFSGLWTFRNEYNNYFLNTHIKISSCFVLNAKSKIFEPTKCSEKFGFICKVRIKYATLFYNQTFKEELRSKEEIRYSCDPHRYRFNDLSACLLYLF
ncbi:uncharacterized protein ACRADG_010787 [Cochliomyia hominivorax]